MENQQRRRKNVLKSTPSKGKNTPPKRRFDFDEMVHSFLLDCRARNLSDRSVQFYKECLTYWKKLFQEQNQKIDITTITVRDIKQYFIGYMLEKGLASNTVNGRIKGCKAFLKFLFEEGIIQENLANELDLIKTEKKMIQTFTKEQVVTLLNQPDRITFTGFRDYTIMMVLLDTGMRIGELLALTVGNLDLKNREIWILKGKGRKARRVPIQKTCVLVLKKYLKERGDLEIDTLFINLDNGPLKIRTIQENIQSYGRMARITGCRVSPHTFRHTMAKFYILNGGDAFSLQQILGHSTLDMVRYYVELFSTDIQEQHEKYSPVENMYHRRKVI